MTFFVSKRKLIGLIASYLLVIMVGFRLPYVNLYTFDFQWRAFIFFTLLLVWLRPSNKFLVFVCLLAFTLGKFTLLTVKLEEISGVLIYLSLFYILIRLYHTSKKSESLPLG